MRLLIFVFLAALAGCHATNPQVVALEYEVRNLNEEVSVLKNQVETTKKAAKRAEAKTSAIQKQVQEQREVTSPIPPSTTTPSIVKPRQINHTVDLLD